MNWKHLIEKINSNNKEFANDHKRLMEKLNSIKVAKIPLQEQTSKKETEGKLSYELDFDFITSLAERMATNKGKYEPYNWKKEINKEEISQALFRHVLEVMKGNYADDGRNLGHLESIALNCMFLFHHADKK